MAEAGDLRLPIAAAGISDGHFDNFQAQLACPKNQVKIAKGVEIAKIGAARLQSNVVAPTQDLGTAQCIRKALRQQPSKYQGKGFVRNQVEEAHRIYLHGIDETGTIDELALAATDRVPEFCKLFGRHSEIRVEDHQQIATSSIECGEDRICLALARLAHRLDVILGVRHCDALDFLPGAVCRMPFDEDDFDVVGKARDAPDGGLDIAHCAPELRCLRILRCH